MGVVQLVHGVELTHHLGLDLGVDLVEEGDLAGGLLAQDEQDGSLHVVAVFESAVGLGDDAPRACDAQAGCPEDQGQVRPDPGVLVGEHHDLQAVVGHSTPNL